MQLRVHIDPIRTVDISIGGKAKDLYLKWKVTGDDEDWRELVDFIMDDVKYELEIYIDDIGEI